MPPNSREKASVPLRGLATRVGFHPERGNRPHVEWSSKQTFLSIPRSTTPFQPRQFEGGGVAPVPRSVAASRKRRQPPARWGRLDSRTRRFTRRCESRLRILPNDTGACKSAADGRE